MKETISHIFDWPGAPLLALGFAIAFFAEARWGLRKRVQAQLPRLLTNFLVSLPSFALLRWAFLPIVVWLAYKNQSWNIGLNYLYALPDWIEWVIAFLLLDYVHYVWHVMLHKIPLLWRFHLVHHTDPDLDVSTALRFHFGELLASIIFRGGMAFLIGATPAMVLVYEIVYELAVQFHHSNWKLPFTLEKWLNKLIVTPRMHGIHHSVIRQETDSNYSIIFSFWDRIHRTVKLNIAQGQVVIGVPSYSDPKELSAGFLLRLPFTKIREWSRDFPQRNKDGKEDILTP